MYETRFIRKEYLNGKRFAEIDIEVDGKENMTVFEIDFDGAVSKSEQLEFVSALHNWIVAYQGKYNAIKCANDKD